MPKAPKNIKPFLGRKVTLAEVANKKRNINEERKNLFRTIRNNPETKVSNYLKTIKNSIKTKEVQNIKKFIEIKFKDKKMKDIPMQDLNLFFALHVADPEVQKGAQELLKKRMEEFKKQNQKK